MLEYDRNTSYKDGKTQIRLKKLQTLPFYKQIKDWNDWYIELYEDFSCERKEQLEKSVGEIIRLIGTLNKLIPGSREDKNDNKEYSKQHYKQNKEKIQEYYKEYSKQYYEQD